MALEILYKIEKPSETQLSFQGDNSHKITEGGYKGKAYGIAWSFNEQYSVPTDPTTNVAQNQRYSGITIVKNLDKDTPFVRECCQKGAVIPKVTFHFFHYAEGKPEHVEYFQVTLRRSRITSSRVYMPNLTMVSNADEIPHLEEVSFLCEEVEWKELVGNSMNTLVIKRKS